jgi:hypothetical protein
MGSGEHEMGSGEHEMGSGEHKKNMREVEICLYIRDCYIRVSLYRVL